MKIESRTKMVEKDYKIYIAIDGTEFLSKQECEKYERTLIPTQNIRRWETFHLPNDETFHIYLINNKDEYDYLTQVYYSSDNWHTIYSIEYNPEIKYYGAVTSSGGDYKDHVLIFDAREYLTDMLKETVDSIKEINKEIGYQLVDINSIL